MERKNHRDGRKMRGREKNFKKGGKKLQLLMYVGCSPLPIAP